MGIINLTPDSFSGDGVCKHEDIVQHATQLAKEHLAQGADIIDLGAESTRPGADQITSDQELERLIPCLISIRDKFPDALISVDTYRSETAALALSNGANWINSVWGVEKDPKLINVIAEHACPFVIMHNTSNTARPASSDKLGSYYQESQHSSLIDEIISSLKEQCEFAKANGIQKDQIIIDPGLGFGKTVSENLEIMKELNRFHSLGYPLLIAASRKSFIGHVLDLPVEERLEGSLACAAIAASKGVDIIRAHDLKETKRILKFCDKVYR